MRLLPGLRAVLPVRPSSHQGGWDEILMFFGAPVTLFVTLRWLGLRKEKREAEAAAASGDSAPIAPSEPDAKPDGPV